ncbi:iron ABC transporter permease [Hydrogenovibrio kuenenii]
MQLSALQVWSNIWSTSDQTAHLVIMDIRFPRVLLGVMVGAALGISGAVMQGLFRNPLADPALVGVSSGAALAAVTVIVLGGTWLQSWTGWLHSLAIPVAAFLGGILVTIIIFRFSTRNGRTDVGLMLLSGIAINAIAGAATGLLTYVASDEALRSLTFWSMGSLASATWQDVVIVTVPTLLALVILPFFARSLNSFLMGESVSYQSGFNVKQLKRVTIGLTALAVGAAVSVSGLIGFVGLVAPHLVRLVLGPDHRWVIPGSALMGGMLVLLSDILARTLLSPAELPIGILMSAIGGPFFLWLLVKNRSRIGL